MSTATVTLTEFILQRVAEDEAAAREAIAERDRIEFTEYGQPEVPDTSLWANPDLAVPAVVVGPERVLAECEAKRRIVDGLGAVLAQSRNHEQRQNAETTLGHLAAVYADHEDYRGEWRP